MVRFIEYSPEYREQCLQILKSNMERYFSPEEIVDFERYLGDDTPQSPYFLLINDKHLVACGGYEIDNDKAFLRWGMVDNDSHGSGLGSILLNERIQHIRKKYKSIAIHIYTSPVARDFFIKKGFIVESIEKDGLAEGIDRVNMKLIESP